MPTFFEAKEQVQALLAEAQGVADREPVAAMKAQRIATVQLLQRIMEVLGEVQVITQTEVKKNPDSFGAYVPYAQHITGLPEPETTVTVTTTTTPDTVTITTPTVSAPVKRPRGRPRKVHLQLTAT